MKMLEDLEWVEVVVGGVRGGGFFAPAPLVGVALLWVFWVA